MTPGGETEGAIRRIHAAARRLQSLGRHGDTVLAHITPAEAELLHKVTDGGSINPVTGLPEFFLGDFFTGLSNGFSGIGESFMSGLSSFSDGLSGLGDSLSGGLGDAFSGIGDSIGDGPTGGLGKASDSLAVTGAKPETPNLLEDNLKPAEPVFRDKVLRPEDRGGPRFAAPPEPKPVRTISAHNAFGAGRRDKAWPKPKPKPNPTPNPRGNLLADPPAVAAPKTMAPPALSNESLSSNRRLADSLAKTSDFTGIKRHIKPGLEKADPLAVAETHDLIAQMNKASPGHGDKLAKELGLADASRAGNRGSSVALRESPGQNPFDKANKTPDGEPYRFKAADGIEGQKFPPAMVSPTKSGVVRPKDDPKGGGEYHARRTHGKHRGVDFVAKNGETIKSTVSGKVVNIGAPYTDGDYKIVDVKTDDGYIVRHFYVSPEIKKGDNVIAGKTSIGKAQNIAAKPGNEGMSNHVHVEVRDPQMPIYEKPGYRRYKDIRPKFMK